MTIYTVQKDGITTYLDDMDLIEYQQEQAREFENKFCKRYGRCVKCLRPKLEREGDSCLTRANSCAMIAEEMQHLVNLTEFMRELES